MEDDSGYIDTFSTCDTAGGPIPFEYPYQGDTDKLASVNPLLLDCLDGNFAVPGGAESYWQEAGSNKVQGVWFYTKGDGGQMTASVCDRTSSSTTLIVLDGEECGTADCVSGAYDEAGCSFTWNASFVDYSLLVRYPRRIFV